MFVNFRISVAVVATLLAKSRVPEASDTGTIDLSVKEAPLLQRALFSEIFEFGKLFSILQNVCEFSRLSYCNCNTIN